MKLEVIDLVRHFDTARAVDGISFTLEAGNIYGFVGPNGAGKTTTMRILATLDEPTSGDALIDGASLVDHPEDARRVTGYMPDGLPTHDDINVHEYIDIFARAYGLRGAARRRVLAEIEDFTNLGPMRHKPIASLSKGMKQRVSLARALVHDPKLLILDEPAAGLDPRARVELRELLRLLAEQGKAVLISSHILTELSEICHGAVIIDQGRIIGAGSIGELQSSTGRHVAVRLRTLGVSTESDKNELLRFLGGRIEVAAVRAVAEAFEVELDGGEELAVDLLAGLVAADFRVVEFHLLEGGLEHVFMSVTGDGGSAAGHQEGMDGEGAP